MVEISKDIFWKSLLWLFQVASSSLQALLSLTHCAADAVKKNMLERSRALGGNSVLTFKIYLYCLPKLASHLGHIEYVTYILQDMHRR